MMMKKEMVSILRERGAMDLCFRHLGCSKKCLLYIVGGSCAYLLLRSCRDGEKERAEVYGEVSQELALCLENSPVEF